ncbi:MAG: hypothetical protein ACPLXC_01220 [Candidatus Pacearchaeota archaeon]
MSYTKNKSEILDKIVASESRDELLSREFQRISQPLHVDGKSLSLKFELIAEDILYRLCRQKGINFEDLAYSFQWFSKDNRIYVISKKFDADLKLLERMSHEEIITAFQEHAQNLKCFVYSSFEKEIFFLSYFEQVPTVPYYGKIKLKKIAQKGRGFDEDGCERSLYRIALHKIDHQH